ncbi:MAG: hypothetical protein HY273_02540 [Gammaproteobacteria bacterium]|nr:hypothetical protein [Gammaproteobacteria bacterium]
MFCSVIRACVLGLLGFSIVGFPTAHATSTLYKRECNGCHSGPPTCNGCHAHGVHKITADRMALNLAAKTDKTEYIAGEDITVTLTGSDAVGTDTGWIRVKLYDDKGVELGQDKTEFPAKLTTRAYAGTTTLYMSWVGYDYDGEGAMYGQPIDTTFGAGQRLSFLAGLHLTERHIEEIVQTNAFIVRDATQSTEVLSGIAATGESKSTSGGGPLDLAWMLVMALFAAIRRGLRAGSLTGKIKVEY